MQILSLDIEKLKGCRRGSSLGAPRNRSLLLSVQRPLLFMLLFLRPCLSQLIQQPQPH